MCAPPTERRLTANSRRGHTAANDRDRPPPDRRLSLRDEVPYSGHWISSVRSKCAPTRVEPASSPVRPCACACRKFGFAFRECDAALDLDTHVRAQVEVILAVLGRAGEAARAGRERVEPLRPRRPTAGRWRRSSVSARSSPAICSRRSAMPALPAAPAAGVRERVGRPNSRIADLQGDRASADRHAVRPRDAVGRTKQGSPVTPLRSRNGVTDLASCLVHDARSP